MPNTSKGFPYPTSSDDPNVPQDIQLLAQAVDTSLNNYSQTTHTHNGVYATTTHAHDGVYANTTHTHNEYLEQSDLAGYSQTTHTHDSQYSGVLHTHTDYLSTAAISGTKGAIPIGTSTGVTIITPGTNDYVLVSDSTTATGTKWANVAAVGTVVPNTFSNIAVSGQTTVSADDTVDTLNLVAGSNVTITTDALTDTITISATGGDLSGHLAAADPHPQYLTQSEADILYDADGSAAAAQSAANIYTDTAISNLVNAAPTTLNTLKELSDALGGDASFATTVTNSLAAKAPLNNPTFTGTVSGITKGMVGLSNVDNTSDDSKPISTATQSALDLKAPLASPTFTGTVNLTGATVTGVYPSQTGNSGKFLTTNGTTVSWASASSGGVGLPAYEAGKYLTNNGTDLSWATIDLSTKLNISDFNYSSINITVYNTASDLPSASTNHGRWAHVHDEGVMYYAHGGSWIKVQKSVANITDTEIGYLDNAKSNLQDQIDARAPLESPTFTGSITTPLVTAGFVKTNSSGILTSTATVLNSDLEYNYITINGTNVALGSSTTVSGLPSQTGNSGYFLTTNGTTASWAQITTAAYSNGTNSGNANKIYYNSSGTQPVSGLVAGDIYIQHEA